MRFPRRSVLGVVFKKYNIGYQHLSTIQPTPKRSSSYDTQLVKFFNFFHTYFTFSLISNLKML